MYEQMNLTARRAAIGIFRALVKFTEHNYTEALDILLRERAEIESKHAYIDPMTRVDFDYHEAIFHFAVGDSIRQYASWKGQLIIQKRIEFFIVSMIYIDLQLPMQ